MLSSAVAQVGLAACCCLEPQSLQPQSWHCYQQQLYLDADGGFNHHVHDTEQTTLEQQALAWARAKLRAAHGLQTQQPEPQPAGVKVR